MIAEDGCGNYFLECDGEVLFWNHETSEKVMLAGSIESFYSGCVEPEDIDLDPDNVTSVWIDPEFSRKHGIEN